MATGRGARADAPAGGLGGVLERYFQIRARGSSVGTEVRGGVTTFIVMAYILVVNPVILSASSEMIRHVEGSVSMPGVTEEIERHARVRVGYQTLDGDEAVEEAEGLLAVCHQHEIDQLNGLFWIERLSRLRRERLVKRYQKQQRGSPQSPSNARSTF